MLLNIPELLNPAQLDKIRETLAAAVFVDGKLPAGHAVVYPSSSLHRVSEVRAGERLVALTWIQSHVRDPARRELLHELNLAREHLLKTAPIEETTGYVNRSYANLLRMWSDV